MSRWAYGINMIDYSGCALPAAGNSFDIFNVRKNYGLFIQFFETNILLNL